MQHPLPIYCRCDESQERIEQTEKPHSTLHSMPAKFPADQNRPSLLGRSSDSTTSLLENQRKIATRPSFPPRKLVAYLAFLKLVYVPIPTTKVYSVFARNVLNILMSWNKASAFNDLAPSRSTPSAALAYPDLIIITATNARASQRYHMSVFTRSLFGSPNWTLLLQRNPLSLELRLEHWCCRLCLTWQRKHRRRRERRCYRYVYNFILQQEIRFPRKHYVWHTTRCGR